MRIRNDVLNSKGPPGIDLQARMKFSTDVRMLGYITIHIINTPQIIIHKTVPLNLYLMIIFLLQMYNK